MHNDLFNSDLTWLDEVFEEVSRPTSSAANERCDSAIAGPKVRRGKRIDWYDEVLVFSMGGCRPKGFKLTEEHKRKIAESNKGVSRKTSWLGRSHSEETKQKLSAINKARVPYVFTAEQKAEISRKISDAKCGKKRSAESIEKSRLSNLGRKQSAAEIEKRAATLRGRKRSPEVIAKVAAASRAKLCRPVMTPYGRFDSRIEVVRALVENGHKGGSFYTLLKRRPAEFFYIESEGEL